MAHDNLVLEISGIGKINLVRHLVNPFRKTISITKPADWTSHTIARWYDEVVLSGKIVGDGSVRKATLTQLDAKRIFEIWSVEFEGVQPSTFSLAADPGKKTGPQKTLETIGLIYERLKIKQAPAGLTAQLTGG